MIVGTPCVASYVGGNADMLNYGECGLLYCYYEPQMLAERIGELFDNQELCAHLSKCSSEVARNRHDPNVLPVQLINIYNDAIKGFTKK
jgi:glycosyltransferase involved in cell wall biosynthesis